MNKNIKNIIILFLLVSFNNTFAQRKQKPFNLSVQTQIDFFSQKTEGQIVSTSTLDFFVAKKHGYRIPMGTVSVRFSKNEIFKKIDIGLNFGLSIIHNDLLPGTYLDIPERIVAFPVVLDVAYNFSQKKSVFQPFVRLKGGYTFLSYTSSEISGYEESSKGGYAYGAAYGFKIHHRKFKQLNNFNFIFGYNNFYTNESHTTSFMLTTPVTVHYKIQRESYSFSIEYVFPQKKKEK